MRPILELSKGVVLLGNYRPASFANDPVGCWLLYKGKEAAIINLPPYISGGESPYDRALVPKTLSSLISLAFS